MKIRKLLCPVRFKTEEDYVLYLECFREGRDFPMEKWVYPFIWREGIGVTKNKEYEDAPFETALIEQ